MGWGFRWRIKILPGVSVNLSKSGPSLSLGRAPLTVNLRRGRIRATVSAPGTGLFYRIESPIEHSSDEDGGRPAGNGPLPTTASRPRLLGPLEGYRAKNPPPPFPFQSSENAVLEAMADPSCGGLSPVIEAAQGSAGRAVSVAVALVLIVATAIGFATLTSRQAETKATKPTRMDDSPAPSDASSGNTGVDLSRLQDVPIPKPRPPHGARSGNVNGQR